MQSENQQTIGGEKNFWLYSKSAGYDLTHPPSPGSPSTYPRMPLQTTTSPIAIAPAKTALVIIDLQNYFVSPAIGRPSTSLGLEAVDKLLQHAIPACRKASIPIVWLNWGLTTADIESMPPVIVRCFSADHNFSKDMDQRIGGMGDSIGALKLSDGSDVEGGRVLMRDQWNSALYAPLQEARQDQDILVHKNRMSGFWGGTEIEEVLAEKGIRTLLFAGVNTDQCVGGSLQDAFSKGWDCLLLSDGCATTTPGFAKQCIEFNTEGGWGFVLSCEDLAKGVDAMDNGPDRRV